MIREDLAAPWIDEHLDPVHVVVAVGLIVAKRFDTGEVLETTPLRVEEGPIDAEVMRVAMHVGHRLAEVDDLLAQRQQVGLVAVLAPEFASVSSSVCGLRSGARVPSVRSQPGLACAMIITATEPSAFASSNVSWSQAMLAALRALNSSGSGLVSHKLLQDPWTLSVT